MLYWKALFSMILLPRIDIVIVIEGVRKIQEETRDFAMPRNDVHLDAISFQLLLLCMPCSHQFDQNRRVLWRLIPSASLILST